MLCCGRFAAGAKRIPRHMPPTELRPDTKRQQLLETLQSNWTTEMSGAYIYGHLAERQTDAARRRSLRALAAAAANFRCGE